MADLKISVIIPVYNTEKYLHQCVDSVLDQTYRNVEVILVDDGSPDDCPRICDEYAENDERVKVIHKKNGGLSSARNAGINVFTGDYVVFLDSDDYWDDELFLEEIVNEKLVKNTDVVIFGYKKYYEIKNKNIKALNLTLSVDNLLKADQVRILVENSAYESQAWTKAVKSDLLKNNDMNFIEGIYSEDIDWSARLLINAQSFDVFDRDVCVYRQNINSISHNISKKNITDLMNNIIRIVKWSDNIRNENYYEWYMNYCAYQYITFLNSVCNVSKSENVKNEIDVMKEYSYLLNYHTNKKVKIVYLFKKLFGYKGMLRILKLYLKLKR